MRNATDSSYNTSILDDIFKKMDNKERISFSYSLKGCPSGKLTAYARLTETDGGGNVNIIKNSASDYEKIDILYLPWKQGDISSINHYTLQSVPNGTLLLTEPLSGCKLFNVLTLPEPNQNSLGPIFHIDAMVTAEMFYSYFAKDEWAEDHWPVGNDGYVYYIHRAGQESELWDLSSYIDDSNAITYGKDNIGSTAIVGRVIDGALVIFKKEEKDNAIWDVCLPFATKRKKA